MVDGIDVYCFYLNCGIKLVIYFCSKKKMENVLFMDDQMKATTPFKVCCFFF